MINHNKVAMELQTGKMFDHNLETNVLLLQEKKTKKTLL